MTIEKESGQPPARSTQAAPDLTSRNPSSRAGVLGAPEKHQPVGCRLAVVEKGGPAGEPDARRTRSVDLAASGFARAAGTHL